MYTKRWFDLAAALFALIFVSPVLCIIAILVRLNMGSPILFSQTRPGLHGELFLLRKFRTMRSPRPGEPELASDAERLTGFGRWLRRTSLDELPELWNVLVGHMSFVGPRPLLTQYLTRYNAEQARRHLVRPGITGWAQVHGRNAVDWEMRLSLDVWYVDHWSLWLDFRILLATVAIVFSGHGVTDADGVTMKEFKGTP